MPSSPPSPLVHTSAPEVVTKRCESNAKWNPSSSWMKQRHQCSTCAEVWILLQLPYICLLKYLVIYLGTSNDRSCVAYWYKCFFRSRVGIVPIVANFGLKCDLLGVASIIKEGDAADLEANACVTSASTYACAFSAC
eukprot:jgi/Botrbrau1/9020/Bobra.0148s0120.1